MEMSVDVDLLEKGDNVIVYGENLKEISKTEEKVLEIGDQTRIKVEIKRESKLGEMRHLSDSPYKEFIGFGEDGKKEMKEEYVKQEAKEDFMTSIKAEIKEECTLQTNKRKLLDEDVKVEMKEEYIEEEIKEFPDSLTKIEIEMDKDHFDLPKKAKFEVSPRTEVKDNRKMNKNQECPSQHQTDENTFQTEKKWDLVPLNSVFIVKCPECQYEEFVKNTNDMNQFSFHMKTHTVFRYPRTAQGYTRSHPCSICSINLRVDELMEHVKIHGYSGPNPGFWNFQQNELARRMPSGTLAKKDKWCVLCPVCPSSKNANFGTRVKICNFPKHVKKTHGSFVYEKMNSEEGALGCQGCGDSKVTLTKIEVHMKCLERLNNNNYSEDLKSCPDVIMRKQIEKETCKKNKESESENKITVSESWTLKQLQANDPSSQINKVTGPADGNEPSGHLGINRCSSGDEASKHSDCDDMMKLVLVVRQDLKMSKGKVAEECCSATLAAYTLAMQKCPQVLRAWEAIRQPKAIVKAKNEEVLLTVLGQARSLGLVSPVVECAGHKKIAPGTKTVVAVGPGPVDLVDQITGALKTF